MARTPPSSSVRPGPENDSRALSPVLIECEPMNPATTGPTAIVSSSIRRTEDVTNAKMRPRSRSSTSSPISVYPMIQAMPAKSPTSAASTSARMKSRISDMISSVSPAPPIDMPNTRLRG